MKQPIHRIQKLGTFGTKLNLKLLRSKKTVEDNRRIAKWVTGELVDLGPTFVKLGQLISTRNDILSAEVIEEFSSLQNEVPAFGNVISVVGEDYVTETFDYFDSEPLASASLGQCHRAITKDGKDVVVKVQRPGIEQSIENDIEIIKTIANIGFFFTRDTNYSEFSEILDEWKPLILDEIDYVKEASNMVEFKELFAGCDWIKVPEVFPELSSKRVLVMAYEPGVKIVDKEELNKLNADLEQIAFFVIRSQFMQVLENGLFHADPHPGNLALNSQGQIVYYDFGLMMKIDPMYKENLYLLLEAVYKKDLDKIYTMMIELNIIIPTGDRASVKSFIKLFLNYVESVDLDKLDVEELKAMEDDRPFRLSTMWVLLIKSIYSVEGIAKTLSDSIALSDVLEPYSEQILEESGLLNIAFTDIQQTAMKIPSSIQSIKSTVDALEASNMRVRRSITDNEKLLSKNKNLQQSVLVLVVSTMLGEQDITHVFQVISFILFVFSLRP
jgi:predicted unusual protein kinase regulating ubiquinone biosynthesis (AarF/ABC1/UbiB family)